MTKNSEQIKLVEKIGSSIEERLRLSPLASRIYALLILSSFNGLSFDDIRETIKASKSSTSVNIKVLIQLGYIKSITRSGDRKRYFKIAKYSSLHSLELYNQVIDEEMRMVKKINAYNKEYHPEKYIEEESLGDIFQDYLLKKKALVEETISKMASFRKNDN